MPDFKSLPVPDLGLRCPHCGSLLAGQKEHRCGQCHRRFNILNVVATHRPVADLGLTCRKCGYSLTGLPGHRCPECGAAFSIRDLLEKQPTGAFYLPLNVISGSIVPAFDDPPDYHVRKREPRFTGHERPLPDFGLHCLECREPLEGAFADRCPTCGIPFTLDALVPAGENVSITAMVPPHLAATVRTILYDDQIPYLIPDSSRGDLSGLSVPGGLRTLVPRAFLFDALHALVAALVSASGAADSDWVCPRCGEIVPANFEVCWSCQATRPESPELSPRGGADWKD